MKSPSLLLVGAVLAIAAAFIVHTFQSGASEGDLAASGPDAPPIVVAARDLEVGHRLNSEDLDEVGRTRGVDAKGSFRAAETLVGRIMVVSRRRGEVIRESDLAPLGSGAAIAEQLRSGQRAITLTLRDSGPGVVLFPGAIVDVLATIERPLAGTGRRETITRTVLERCRVLAVNDDAVGSRAVDPEGRRNTARRLTVTFAVSPAEAALLELASARGTIGITLRGDGDTAEGTPALATTDALLGLLEQIAAAPEGDGDSAATAPAAAAPSLAAPDWEVVVIRGENAERISFPARRNRSER